MDSLMAAYLRTVSCRRPWNDTLQHGQFSVALTLKDERNKEASSLFHAMRPENLVHVSPAETALLDG